MASPVTSQVAAAELRQCSYCRHRKLVCDESRLSCGEFYCSYGCTAYAKKRRLLRQHRENMRVMDNLIQEHGLDQELEDRLIDETGNTNFFLGDDDFMDEDSEEDPEAALRRELADQSAFVEAASGALQHRKVATDLERARMMLEDVRSRQLQ